jgi:hypothetical protein
MIIMIHSNKHGMITKSGDSYFSEEGMTQKSGNMMFHPDGSMSQRAGENMIFGTHGMINVSGNMLFTPNGTFTLTGNMLLGPDGETWYGVNSIDEAKDIVAMACARKPEAEATEDMENTEVFSGGLTAEELKNITPENWKAIALTMVIIVAVIAVVWWIAHW